jgi:hypothetical protein
MAYTLPTVIFFYSDFCTLCTLCTLFNPASPASPQIPLGALTIRLHLIHNISFYQVK